MAAVRVGGTGMAESDDAWGGCRTKLGDEFVDAFHGLRDEWAWSVVRRDEFRVLFTRDEDVSLLNALAGGGFGWDIQRVLWDDLLLRVCRLTDPAQSGGGKQNLTVRRLPAPCGQHDASLGRQVGALVDDAVEKARFARDWRNRRISHSDWATFIGQADPLAPASLEHVSSALDAVHAILNTVSNALVGAEMANLVMCKPRARAFLAYARQLADSVQFMEAALDPNGATPMTDIDAAAAFLDRLGLRPTADNVRRVIELREAARRFS